MSESGLGDQKREKQLLDRIKSQDAEIADLKRQVRRLKQQSSANDHQEEAAAPPTTTSEAPPVVKASLLRPSPGCEPPALEGHAGVAYDGKLVVFGGTPNGSKAPAAALHTLNIANGMWKAVPCSGDVPAPRNGHTATLIGKSMIVFGGLTPEGISGTMYEMDLVSYKWSQVDPHSQKGAGIEQVKGHSTAIHQRRMYVFGGVTPQGRTNLMHCFNIGKGEWLPTADFNDQVRNQATETEKKTSSGAVASPPSHAEEDAALIDGSKKKNEVTDEEADLPAPRSGHSCCTYSRKSSLVVFGGRTGATSCSNEVFSYCLGTKQWTQMYCGGEHVPAPRCDHNSLIAGDQMYVFGGYSVEGGVKTYFNDLYVLDLVTFSWQALTIEGKRGVPSPGCSRVSCLFEDPNGQLCLLVHGGWVTKEEAAGEEGEGGACSPTSETWVLRLALKGLADTKVARHQPVPPPSKSLIRLTTSANARNGTLPEPRPTTSPAGAAGSGSSPRGVHSKGAGQGGGDESRPWISQTSKAQSARFFGDPLSAPVPPPPEQPKRPKEDIEKIVGRLSNTAIVESRKLALAKKYLYNGMRKEVAPLTAEEQEESVNRLYYEQLQFREERLAELENNFYPPEEPKDHDEDEMYDMIERLSVQPAHRQLPAINAANNNNMAAVGTSSSLSTKAASEREGAVVMITPEQVKESVNRLYYEQQEISKKKRLELEQRYLSRPVTKPSPRRSAEEMNGIIDRLNHKGGV